MCRWVHVLLVFGYVILTIMIAIVLLMVFGVRMADWVPWVMFVGWFVLCFGGVWVAERLSGIFWPDCRKPIRAEEERLSALVQGIWKRRDLGNQANAETGPDSKRHVGSGLGFDSKRWVQPEIESNPMHWVEREMGMNSRQQVYRQITVRFLIRSAAEKKDGSIGYRTILIQSGTLPLASDNELRGILAHELGHLRDGDRVMEAAWFTAGLLARLFRGVCLLIGRGFRVSLVAGLLLAGVLFLVLIGLLPFFLLDKIFRAFRWALSRQIDYRQDAFAFQVGCGDGLRAWLEKSGLAANVSRIRRLEKMK